MARRRRAHRTFDLAQLGEGEWIVGVDEVGRGCLAGPVMAGAVLLHRSFYDSPWCRKVGCRVDDSKNLKPEEREELLAAMHELSASGGAVFAVGSASVVEIDELNILGATRLAMRRALMDVAARMEAHMRLPEFTYAEGLFADADARPAALVLVDGSPLKPFPYAHRSIVKGDGRSLVIGMASIAAKVTRDRLMVELHGTDPRYGYNEHKGYCTRRHCQAIREHGPTQHHRPLFLRKILANTGDLVEQVDLELKDEEVLTEADV